MKRFVLLGLIGMLMSTSACTIQINTPGANVQSTVAYMPAETYAYPTPGTYPYAESTYAEPVPIDQTTGYTTSVPTETSAVSTETLVPNTGAIVSPETTTTVSGPIDIATAESIAMTHAGVDAASATISKSAIDYDDGRQTYEIDFYAGDYKYDYKIDVNTGTVLEAEREMAVYSIGGNSGSSVDDTRAKQIALERVPGASTSNIVEWKFEYDDGIPEYEGKIIYGGVKYEFTINANNGSIMEWEQEGVRW